MSFGWSASDIVSAVKFLAAIGNALKESGGAEDTYREDCLFLESIENILNRVGQSSPNGGLSQAAQSLTVDIVTQIQTMRSGLDKYAPTLSRHQRLIGRIVPLRRGTRKVQYGVFVSAEVQKLRVRISQRLQALQLDLGATHMNVLSDLRDGVSHIPTSLNDLQTNISRIPTSLIENVRSPLEAKLDNQTASLSAIRQRDLLRQVLAWLNPVMAFEDKHQDCRRNLVSGSCDWIMGKPEYKHWHSDGGLLWVTGIPGAGKTILASWAITQLLKSRTVLYFYCEARTELSRNATNIISTLLWQLLKCNEDLLDHFTDGYGLGGSPNMSTMKPILHRVLQLRPGITIVVDGIDECATKARQEICEMLISLPCTTQALVFSRDIGDIRDILLKDQHIKQATNLEITTMDTEADIKHYIAGAISSLPNMDQSAAHQITNAIQRKAQGMFLWVHLVVRQIQNGCLDLEDQLEAIEDMPNSLNELYDGVLRRIHAESTSQAIRQSRVILQWLTCAQRPLRLYEIAAASKLTPNRLDERCMPGRSLFGEEEIAKVLRRRCGTLVRISVTESRSTISLVHETAKAFLLRYEGSSVAYKEMLVDATLTHAFIARSCLTYLCYENLEFAPFQQQRTSGNEPITVTRDLLQLRFQSYLEHNHLLEYATTYWADHVSLSDVSEDVYHSIQRLQLSERNTVRWLQVFLRLHGDRDVFRSSTALKHLELIEAFKARIAYPSEHFDCWLSHLKGPRDGRFDRWERFLSSGQANDFLPSLHVAAFFDFAQFVNDQLRNGTHVDERSVDGQTALHLAARADSTISGQMLISHGADVNSPGWSTNTPLSWAIDGEAYETHIRSGKFRMAEVLLAAGSKADDTCDPFSPLHRASGIPMPDDPFLLGFIRSLLQHGAHKHINGRPRDRPPLGIAAALGAPKLAQLLIEHGADPNGGREGDTYEISRRYPLIAGLSRNANTEVIRVLLEAGANPNVSDPAGRSPLQVCLGNAGSQELMTMLLDFGADVNHNSADGSTALHIASSSDNPNIVAALIAHGACLGVEDVDGKTPLIHAIEKRCFRVARMLVDAGASTEGSRWKASLLGSGSIEWTSATHWPQNEREALEVYWMLRRRFSPAGRSGLPRHFVVQIMETAKYWVKTTSSRTASEKYDENRSSLDQPYLLSIPVVGCGSFPVRRIKITVWSHDQGWSSYKSCHGTYENSSTWFEVVIQKADGSMVDIEQEKGIYSTTSTLVSLLDDMC
ncbi:uncharacterized protein PG986_009409 [Apiospora aurea]|uniref:NACHT domain-containing protein n=1 Tax=Apiospora aurea TaxID=335848 RepID=A0ABR1Q7V0_9PEZI